MSELAKIKADETTLPADPMVSMIERIAMDPSADIAKLERMLDMKERHEQQVAKSEHDLAFAKASAEFPDIPLNGLNRHTNQPYALLRDIIKYTRPVLAKYGFSLSFSTGVTERDVIVTAELAHQSGHSKKNSLPLPRDTGAGRNAVQAVGSTQTYGQRYTAQAVLGLSLGEDTEDDGNTSGKREPDNKEPAKQYSWANTVIRDMPENSTDRQKAEAVADALCAQWKRMKGARQLFNEWDRRAEIIEGDKGLEGKYPDLHERVIDAYELHLMELKGE